MTVSNKKINSRSIALAVALLVITIFSITTMCYSLGSLMYMGKAVEGYAENGFGLMNGNSLLLLEACGTYGGYIACSIILLIAGLAGIGMFLYYLCSIFIEKMTLRSDISACVMIGINFFCSIMYLIEGSVLVNNASLVGANYSLITYSYVPFILSLVGLGLFVLAYMFIKEGFSLSNTVGVHRKDKAGADGRLSEKDMEYLLKMKELLDAKILTEDEYAAERAKVLDAVKEEPQAEADAADETPETGDVPAEEAPASDKTSAKPQGKGKGKGKSAAKEKKTEDAPKADEAEKAELKEGADDAEKAEAAEAQDDSEKTDAAEDANAETEEKAEDAK